MTKRRKAARKAPPLSVSARVNLLSEKRRAIIRLVLERPREYVLLSVRALAERLKTDPATIVRIVRGMQFASYREFQQYLHGLSILYATSLETMRDAGGGKTTTPGQIRLALDQDKKNLDCLSHSLDARKIALLVRRLYKAARIVLVGGDMAAHLVRIFEHHLIMLGLPVSVATSPAEAVHKIRHAGKKDLVIAFTFRRGLRQTVEGLRQARANGAHCVAITNTPVSPIAQFAHECFLAPVEATSFGDSYVAPVAWVNVVVGACANYRRSRTLALMKKVEEEQRHGFRWYES